MSYNLLLVENDQMLSKAIKQYLIDQGFNVYIAINGLEALNLVGKYTFDLIISDIMMPVVNGYEFLEKLQQNKKLAKIPVVFLTAKGMTQDRIKGYDMGCHGYLSKPFDPEELLSLIRNLISREVLSNNLLKKDNKTQVIHLTPRERSVVKLVIDGCTNKEIAIRLDTSTRNVEKYVSRLLQKTNTKNRTLLVKYFLNRHLIEAINKGE